MGHSFTFGGGEPHRYARYLANQAFRALVDKGAKAPVVFQAYDDKTVAVLPIIDPAAPSVTLWIFYDPKAALTLDTLMTADPKELTTLWRKFCRAFVVARFSPASDRYMVVLDHDATRNAASSLRDRRSYVLEVDPRELDEALGTKLTDAHFKRWLRTDVYGRSLLEQRAA